MKCAEAERPDVQQLDSVRTERLLECGWLQTGNGPPGEQQQHGVRSEPPQRECERAGGRGVQPLEIVDGQQKGLVLSEQL
jgi:hypothetical protein